MFKTDATSILSYPPTSSTEYIATVRQIFDASLVPNSNISSMLKCKPVNSSGKLQGHRGANAK
jgi:hypothetical protein